MKINWSVNRASKGLERFGKCGSERWGGEELLSRETPGQCRRLEINQRLFQSRRPFNFSLGSLRLEAVISSL